MNSPERDYPNIKGNEADRQSYVKNMEPPVSFVTGDNSKFATKAISDCKERKKYFLRRVEIGPDHLDGIKPGTYFETQFTPDEWNSPKTNRPFVARIIRNSMLADPAIPQDVTIVGIPEYKKDGKVVIKAEIRQNNQGV